MNDGKAPRKGIFSYILPYILMAAGVIFLVVLIVRQFSGSSVEWAESELDSNIGYVVNEAGLADSDPDNDFKFDGGYKIVNAKVSESNRIVTVTGTYIKNDAKNTASTYSVVFQNETWNKPFTYIYTAESGEIYYLEHASYSTVLRAKIDQYLLANPNAEDCYMYSVDAFEVSFWDVWGPTILSGLLTVGGAIFLLSFLNRSLGNRDRQAMDFNKSPAKRENSKVRFEDVAGCDEEKAEMVELVEYLKNPKEYSKFGAKLPKGFLLIGPPGTGKTLLAKAVAGEADVPFYSLSGSDFVEMFVGVGAGRVRDLFKKAKQTAPCLIFIDEIDAVGRQRGAGLGGGNDEREQTLNQLLVEMDGFAANNGILVIAATNRDDVLDPALRRAGRFDRTITVGLPDKKGREAIFKVHARGKLIDPEVDFAALAARTVGFSGADIENILNEAAILAVRRKKSQIDLEDIDEAVDRRIGGPAKSSKGLSPEERRQIAYHESGHAIIGMHLAYSDKVQKITIIPRGNTGGHVLMTPEDDRFLLTKKQLMAKITGLLGGRTSEEIFFNDVSTGASSDIQEATRIARLMVTELGMSSLGPIQYEQNTGSVFLGRDYTSTAKNFSTQIAFEIDKEVRRIIDECHEQANDILCKYKSEVILIAETLLEKETITAEEIEALVKSGKIEARPADESLEKKEETGKSE